MPGRLHSRARDRQAVTYHYEHICNDFFALWLDPRMVYSCAYFATAADDLETAQLYKLDYVCRKLRLQRGERLLDIGCGWGALVIHAAQHYGVEAHGVTLSAQQAELARERIKKAGLEGRCRVDICDYRDVSRAQKYDKLASVGFAEHVGEAFLATYFKCACELLRPGGVLLNHAIGVHSATPLPGLDFVQRYLFPDAETVPLSTTLRAAESVGFGIRDVENLKEHYAHTARHWLRRLEESADEARRLGGEVTYRSLRLVFLASVREFTSGSLNLYQSLLIKLNNGRSGLPLRRADWYA
jgi:cyclopropane-fatty-acyl-phospholipid synthase